VNADTLTLEHWPVSRLVPYPHNPRRNDGVVDRMCDSIREFGFRIPVLARSDGTIVDGHLRLKAALKLGIETVPVILADGLSDAQVKAFRLMVNQSVSWAEWDEEALARELAALQDMDFDLSLTGFDGDEIDRLLADVDSTGAPPGLTDEDDVPEPPEDATTQPGDLWILGDHRLLCCDSSDPAAVDRLVDGLPIHLVNTDPPYGVRVEPRSNNAIAAGLSSFAPQAQTHHQALDLARHPEKAKPTHSRLRAKDRPLANDFLGEDEFNRLLRAWFGNLARVLEPGRAFYIWGGYANLGNYPPALRECGLYFSQGIVWDKEHPVLTRKDFMGAFEIAFYGWREGAAHQFFGPNNATDLWHVKKVNPQSMEHLTQKPVELARRAIEYSSRRGENVLDLFGGSGSTLIAAEQTGRHAFLMEIDGPYCDLIADRYQRFTGKPAVLERTGTSPIPMKPREADMR